MTRTADDPGFAPAKINLTLHVTGRRADGYHLLDSLVVFAGVGDRITVAPSPAIGLTITGPFAAGLPQGSDNLVLRAARLMDGARGAALKLEKCLPPASGIGGGSSDAAATLRLLSRLWGLALPDRAAAARLGADVPACLEAPRPCRMGGIGEKLSGLPALPPAWLVLVNPGIALATPAVFAALDRCDGAPMPAALPHWPDTAALAAFVQGQRNDLEPAARQIAPAISDVLAALDRQAGCLLARMSGSGATCFGLFASESAARSAARRLDRPGWWVAAAAMLTG